MEVTGQLHAPSRFTPRKRAPGNDWMGGWEGPRAVLDAVMKRKIPVTAGNPNLEPPIVQNIL